MNELRVIIIMLHVNVSYFDVAKETDVKNNILSMFFHSFEYCNYYLKKISLINGNGAFVFVILS